MTTKYWELGSDKHPVLREHLTRPREGDFEREKNLNGKKIQG